MNKGQFLGWLCIILAAGQAAYAQPASGAIEPGAASAPVATSALKQELEQTYQKLLKNPANVALNLRYAEIAIQLKDYEAAIPPLERLLFYNPALDDVKLKLGILYYLLQSPDMARTYFNEVSASGTASQDLKVQANQYLKKLGG